MIQRGEAWPVVLLVACIVMLLGQMSAPVLASDVFDRAREQAQALAKQEKYLPASEAFEALIEAEERTFGPNAIELAADLVDLGSAYGHLARYPESEEKFKRAIQLLRSAPNGNPRHLAIALNDLGVLYYRMGRYREAEDPSKESIEIRKKIFDPSDVRITYPMDNLGLVYLEQGRHEEAEELFQNSIGIARSSKSAKDEAISLDNLGYLYWAQGRLKDAENLHRIALDLEDKAPDASSADIALTCNSLGSVLVEEGLLTQAEPFLQRALKLWEGVYGPDHPQVAYALANLGALFKAQRRLIEAEPLLRRALEIREMRLGADHPNTAIVIDKVAELLIELGDGEQAEKLAASSLAKKKQALGPDHPETANTFDLLSRINQQRGRLLEALEFARASFAIRQRRASIIAQTRSLGADSEVRKVREGYIRHVSILETLISAGATDGDKLFAEAFEVGQSAQASAAANASFQAGIRNAVASPDIAALIRERQDAIDAWRGADAQRSKLIALPLSQRSSDTERAATDEIKRLAADIERLDNQIAREYPRFAELAAPRPLPLGAARAKLNAGEMLISVVIGTNSAFLFAVGQSGAELKRLETDSDRLNRDVDALREMLDPQRNTEMKSFDVSQAHALYQRTLGRASQIGEVNSILFVPDGAFLSLPIGVLVQADAAAGADYSSVSWLVRKYVLTVLPSVSMIATIGSPTSHRADRRPFVGIGNPLLEGSDPKAALPSLKSLFRGPFADVDAVRLLPPLPETARELEELARYRRASAEDLFLGNRATETIVKGADLARYRLVAFATHGLLAGDVRGLVEPALVLTPPAKASTADDGLLTASEIARLKLDADWVVLSACNTASGDRSGTEGLSGIAKAFIYAGSRALLVSHWKVVSESALKSTTGIFAAMDADASANKAEALQRSQIAAIKDGTGRSHPLYWAPFVLVGDPTRD
jgi:CHAT domain-containing protein/Tfp pilus assembly protein PilF